eukprot:Trichotokara_eunicae@DN5849_c0_g1_i1.p3
MLGGEAVCKQQQKKMHRSVKLEGRLSVQESLTLEQRAVAEEVIRDLFVTMRVSEEAPRDTNPPHDSPKDIFLDALRGWLDEGPTKVEELEKTPFFLKYLEAVARPNSH